MKLTDLATKKIDFSRLKPVDFKGRKWFPMSGEFLGQGVQQQAWHTGQGVVTKMAIVKDRSDPTLQFLRLARKNQDNPFFPKIYSAKMYTDKKPEDKGGRGHKIVVVQMEKLTPIKGDKTHDVAMSLFDQIGLNVDNETDQNRIGRDLPRWKGREDKRQKLETKIRALKILDKTLTDENFNEWIKNSNNPKFIRAMKLLYPYWKKYGNDMHEGNWMLRLSSHGPQLVALDPFYPTTFHDTYADDF